MPRVHLWMAGGLLLVGCSEYGFRGEKGASPGAEDSAPPDEIPVDSGEVEVPTCADFAAPAIPSGTLDETCLRAPTAGVFDPVVEWQWDSHDTYPGYNQIMSTPAVGHLNDDDGDGVIGDGDIPDVVFTTFTGSSYSSAGVLTAISGDSGAQLWALTDAGGYRSYASSGVAIGDLDADGVPEVCVSSPDAAVLCVNGPDGSFKFAAGTETSPYGCPAMADMDGDGMGELLHGRQIFDHLGNTLGVGTGASGGGYRASFAVDWDADGELELVAGGDVYERDGTRIFSDGGSDGFNAVADFDGDGLPDVVVSGGSAIRVTANDGTALWSSAVPGGGGGAPTVADFDGDGAPEIGMAGLAYYTVFETDGSVLWSNSVQDVSSSVTGSSVFDFEGDGTAEVVYADETTLWIFDGATGAVLMSESGHGSGTLGEYPLVADVDGDDSTEIILASNNYAYGPWTGITIIGSQSGSWAPARPIWNQFAYHITNVENDGGLPATQARNWETWNNFRAGGTELGPSHWLADLAPGQPEICREMCALDVVTVYLPVTNSGLLDATGALVQFSRLEGGAEVPVVETPLAGLPSTRGAVLGPFEITATEWGAGRMVARVDANGDVEECDEDDNVVLLGEWPCD